MNKAKHRYFTFLYVPAANSGLKTVRIPKWLVATFGATLVILITATTVAVLKYASKFGDTYRLATLQQENETLRRQIETQNQQVYQFFLDQGVSRVIITHPHVDHFGQAGLIAAHSDAQVWVSSLGYGSHH